MNRRVKVAGVAVTASVAAAAGWLMWSGQASPRASLEALAAATPPRSSAPSIELVAPTSSPITIERADGDGVLTSQASTSTTVSQAPLVAPQATAAHPLDAIWTIERGENVFVGYRIDEQFAGAVVKHTATGRSLAVSGTVRVADDQATAITLDVDMTVLSSGMGARDGFMRIEGLKTDSFPTASFSAAGPLDIGALKDGKDLSVTLPGTLTLKGVSAPVTIELVARFDGTAILIAGQAPISLSDFNINPPTNPFVSVDDRGTMEFQLRFVSAGR
jgi:polyisoprenoid-binding protein YceI